MKHSFSWSPRTAGSIALGLLVAAPLLAAPPRKAPPRPSPARPLAAKPGPAAQKKRPGLVEVMPVTPRAAQEVARLTALAKQGAWDDWLRQYQRLVEDETLLLPQGERLLLSLRTYCHDEFAKLPPAAKQRYRTLFDADAAIALDAARKKGPAQVAEVYGRYRNTTAGRTALRWLADQALDYGEWEMARAGYRRLTASSEVTQAELLRHALAAERAGAAEEAARALARAREEFGAANVRIGGRRLNGAAAVGLFRAAAVPAAAAEAAQPAAPLGGAAAAPPTALPPGPLQALWTRAFPAKPAAPVQEYYSYRYRSTSRGDFPFLSYPAAVGDRIYLQGPREILALDGASGKPHWERKGFTLPEGEDLPRYASRRRRDDGPYVYSGGRPFQGMPAIEGGLLAARVPLVPASDGEELWPGKPGIAVFRMRDGEPLWQQSAGPLPYDTCYNAPRLRSGVVFTGMASYNAGITEFHAVALRAGTGEPLWRTYLGGGSHCVGAVDGSPALVDEDRVWIETTLHTVAALDLLTGQVLMVYRAPLPPDDADRFSGPRIIPNRGLALLPSRAGGIICAPRWGTEIVALDGGARKVAWTAPLFSDKGRPRTGVVFAADERRAYLVDSGVDAVDLADGKTAWRYRPEGDRTGYPTLAGERIYLPVEGKVHVLAAADGKELEILDTAAALGGKLVYPALTVVGDRLLAVTDTRVVAFGKRPVMRDE